MSALLSRFVHPRMLNSFLSKNRTSGSEFALINKTAGFGRVQVDRQASNTNPKPPNILIYCPGHGSQLPRYVDAVESCLSPDQYTVYPITSAKFASDPWIENTAALIISPHGGIKNEREIRRHVDEYLKVGGKVLSFDVTFIEDVSIKSTDEFKVLDFGSELDCVLTKSDQNLSLPCKLWSGKAIYADKPLTQLIQVRFNGKTYSVAVSDSNSNHCIASTLSSLNENEGSSQRILSYLLHHLGLKTNWNQTLDLYHKRNESVGFLFSKPESKCYQFLNRVIKDFAPQNTVHVSGLAFIPSSSYNDKEHEHICSDSEQFPVIFPSPETQNSELAKKCSFNWKVYFSNLSTRALGQIVLYADVISSTMQVFDGILLNLTSEYGVIAIARQQTKGQGRSTNKWLSPVGCAMFTLPVIIPINSYLGHRLPFLQHMMSVAVVHAIRMLDGVENVDLRVKWPNDIYFGTSIKLGGVMVKSTVIGDSCIASIGCGVNIANSKPTVCVNDILREKYSIDKILTCQEVIALTVTQLENIIEDFQQNGPETFLKLYYKYWIHRNSEVEVQVDESLVASTIVGVDDCGFLLARRHDNGDVMSLQPDGNTFDITRNLIAAKR
ncbi:biotin--protein ligase-like [Clavelina lepadiformis]|uniref:biotin--protein ligase-like n=1 Tax=Clavelina lepadiformis TaxID=159417 RepID=UPI00404138C1